VTFGALGEAASRRLLPTIARQPFERGAHQALDAALVTHVDAGFTHRLARFSFTKTKVS
jgi:hypothetical protein